MAEITKSSSASMDITTAAKAAQITGLFAGEDLAVADALYLKSDGLVYRASGAAANANAVLLGFASRTAKSGQPVTPYGAGTRFKYADATLTPGAKLFLSGTVAGGLADVATTGDAVGVAQCINDSEIRVTRQI